VGPSSRAGEPRDGEPEPDVKDRAPSVDAVREARARDEVMPADEVMAAHAGRLAGEAPPAGEATAEDEARRRGAADPVRKVATPLTRWDVRFGAPASDLALSRGALQTIGTVLRAQSVSLSHRDGLGG
jgi:hypothetical protein